MRVFNNVESIFIYKTVSPYVYVCMLPIGGALGYIYP